MTLLDLAKLSRSLNDMLEETGGELTPEIEKSLELNKDNISQKVDAYYFQIEDFKRRFETMEKVYNEAKRCMALYEGLIENLENRMEIFLREMNIKEVTGEYSKFQMVRTKPVVKVDPQQMHLISDDYFKVKTEKYLDKIILERDLKSGMEIKGVTLTENYYLKYVPNNIKSIKGSS